MRREEGEREMGPGRVLKTEKQGVTLERERDSWEDKGL